MPGRWSMPVRPLTVKERILLHLFDYNRSAESYEVPADVTQAKIAEAVGVHLRHLGQYLNPLVAEELVEERKSHIRKGRQKLKAYFLSGTGRQRVASLRNALLGERVPLRARSGDIEEVALSTVYQEVRHGSTLLELRQELDSIGYLSPEVKAAKPEFVDFSQEAPKVERFYGREKELREALEALERVPVLVVTGLAGMGKTTLGAKVCDTLRGRRPLFWREVRPWDTAMDLAFRLSGFLKSLGRTGLHNYLVGHGPRELSRIEELLATELADLHALVVLDDVQKASEDAVTLLSILVRVLRDPQDGSVLLLSRTVPGFYSRREVAVDRVVVEIPLRGLDPRSRQSFLLDAGVPNALAETLAEASGGSPLFLKILANAAPLEAPEKGWSTLEAYITEEIEPYLSGDERECLRVASFYKVPVSTGGLLLEEQGGSKTVIDLQRKGLLDELDNGRIVSHDFLRNYFQKGLPSERKGALVDKVVPWLLGATEGAVERGNLHDAVGFLENALRIEVRPDRYGLTLVRLGDVRRLAGDYLASTESYRAAMEEVEDPRVRARLHERIAANLQSLRYLDEAEQEVERGLRLLPQEPSLEAGWLLLGRAGAAFERGDFTRAFEEVDRVLSWMPLLSEDPSLKGHLEHVRGLVLLFDSDRADPALAKADFQSAMEAFRSIGDHRRLDKPYMGLALAALEMGQAEEAFRYLEEAIQVTESTGYLPGHGVALFAKARLLSECLGDYQTAEMLYRESYEIAKSSQERFRLTWFHRHFADLYERQGRFEEARESQEYFLVSSGEALSAEAGVENRALLVRLSLACRDPESAEGNLREAEGLGREARSESTTYFLEWARGSFHAFREEAKEAEAAFRRALDLRTPGHRGSTVQEYLASASSRGELLLDYGKLLVSMGKKKLARDILLEARNEFRDHCRKPMERRAQDALDALGSRGKR